MRNIYIFLIMLLCVTPSSFAQTECGFEGVHNQLMLEDAAYAQSVQAFSQAWKNFQQNKAAAKMVINGIDTVYEIPVVMHVMHSGEPIGHQNNPTDAHLIALLDYVNKSYEASWGSYPDTNSGGVRVPFRFVFAKRDPSCNPTTGIVRANAGVLPGYTQNGVQYGGNPANGVSHSDIMSISAWPRQDYYNIWIVHRIGGGGIAGYAYLPPGGNNDGTMLDNGSGNVGQSTLVHELGHAMGLYHTFEGDGGGGNCPINNDCNTDGDEICDTEPHDRSQVPGCGNVNNPCTGMPFNFTQHSFMSYSHACRDRFTQGQKERMLFSLLNYRSNLISSDAVLQPPPPLTGLACAPTTQNPGSNQNIGPRQVVFEDINNTTQGYGNDGLVHADYTCSKETPIYAGQAHNISVYTTSAAQKVRAYIDYNNDGQFQVPAEEVFSSNGSLNTQVHTGIVNVPIGAPVLCQRLRMRVISDVSTAPDPTPCIALERGQAEDYTVVIKPQPLANATISITQGNNPTCKDSLIEFTANVQQAATGYSVVWFVNGIQTATGNTYSTNTHNNGDVVHAVLIADNQMCNTPDSINSNNISISHVPPAAPPFISYIGNMLISDKAPVNWYGPNGLIPGITTGNYHPTVPGQYYARYLGSGCPSDSSNILTVVPLNVDEHYLAETIKIYPNPAQKELHIDIATNTRLEKLTVINNVGQSVTTMSDNQLTGKLVIHTETWPAGVYFIVLQDINNHKEIFKVSLIK